MPLMEYECSRCEKVFEIIVSLDEYPKKIECPYCDTELKRVCITPPRVASWNYINGSKVMG